MSASLLATLLLLATPLTPGEHERQIEVDGRQRTYLVHVPPGHDACRPTAVVLAFHGAGMNARVMKGFSGIDEKADTAGFLAVFPNGTGAGKTFLTFNAGGVEGILGRGLPDDVKFTAAVLDDLAAVTRVDPRRIFATGMSNGGMMCYRLASELSDRIAAIAPVAGTMAIDECAPRRPVPVMHFHGTADRFVPFQGPNGGTPGFVKFKSVDDTIAAWVKANACPATPAVAREPDVHDDGTSVQRKSFGPGRDGAEVVLWVIDGGGHTWPGREAAYAIIGRTTLEISANDLMWQFFERHPLTMTDGLSPPSASRVTPSADDIWALARQAQDIHRFSTLFTSQQVRDDLGSDAGIDAALEWCRRTAITKVYLETFRDGYQADRAVLEKAKRRFQESGVAVSGCVTTTGLGQRSSGWKVVSCYTHPGTQNKLREVFAFAASLFDEIMIDDFLFTDCTCNDCQAARAARTVTIGEHTHPVDADTWEAYRGELMVRLSQDHVLGAARAVNPQVQLIIKYPQWYDQFHERGYDVERQTALFDRIWVGTETRDYDDRQWGGTAQYEGYFLMRWLAGIGGAKCGGGWYDPYGTTERTYVEQARQTILAGARESMLFCYGALQQGTGPKNIEALRQQIPELLSVAREVACRQPVGIAAYKPANSHAAAEPRIYDFVGMLGLPLVPCHVWPADARVAFLPIHALKDPQLATQASSFLESGKTLLLSADLKARLPPEIAAATERVVILPETKQPAGLLDLPQETLDALRRPLLEPLGHSFQAPSRVALYVFSDGSWVIENFNDRPVPVQFDGQRYEIPARGWQYSWKGPGGAP